MKETALYKLSRQISNKKHICVGLDTDKNKIPHFLLSEDDPVFAFNKAIIDSTRENAGAYKLNFAFYECDGIEGIKSLLKTIEYISDDHFIIGDAKRGDIGNTAEKYAHSLFNHFNVDASTLHPYMGFDSLQPFFDFKDKLNFVLVLTSNKGANDFEKLKIENGKYLYQNILSKLNDWNVSNNIGVVFGATQIEELRENINHFGDMPVLLPGVGAQGGSLAEVVSSFTELNNYNFLINSSRGIIYKSQELDFADKAGKELETLNMEVLSNYK